MTEHYGSGLSGRVAAVTGGGAGLGRAIAIRLAREGAAVAVWGRTMAPLEETVALIAAEGGRAIACQADCTVSDAITAAFARTRDTLGPISILINNAGLAEFGAFLDLQQDEFEHMLRVNVVGPFLCSQAVLPDMQAAGWGRIINISSLAGQEGEPHMAHYSASKGGVIALTKAMAIEFADRGITINHVPPFAVWSPRMREVTPDVEMVVAMTPVKRIGLPEEVAAACAYLASDEAGFVTGQGINVNGGYFRG